MRRPWRCAVLGSTLLLLAQLPASAARAPRNHVRKIQDIEMLQSVAQRQRRFLVFMHEGAELTPFQPWLFALAQLVPHFTMATMDVAEKNALVKHVFKLSGTPLLKLFVRDNPKGERIIDYTGPLEFEALLGWARAVIKGESHKFSTFAAEPPEGPTPPEAKKQGSKGGSAMDRLPEGVRAMATTMVRERRLQRILGQYGDGRAAQYDQQVSHRYRQIVAEEGLDLSDKVAVQDANRRARDLVRDEILADAPDQVRDEVMGEVNMGDAAAQQGGAPRKGGRGKDEL